MTFLDGTRIELIRPGVVTGKIRYALFDFDGTLSLIREGWQSVMIPMMVDLLVATPAAEAEDVIMEKVREFVTDLTGKQTIYQMIRLAEEIESRGGVALEPLTYKRIYHDRLMQRIRGRIDDLEAGRVPLDDLMVPGSREMLEELRRRGVACYLASGTDEAYVRHEAGLLDLPGYFEHIYGALDDYKRFDKRLVVQHIIAENHLSGPELVGFGDGYVEIEDVCSAGGVAVGIASNEAERQGIDSWKRSRLIRAGADLIIPDFREHAALCAFLFAE